MSKIIIVVEGKSDQKFFKYYLNFLNRNIENLDFELLNSKSNLKNNENSYKRETNKGNKVIVILDFDNEKCEFNKLCKKYKEQNTIFDYHLIRNNLENLLISITNNIQYLNCFQHYEKCINKELSDKSRFYAYLEANNENPQKEINYDKIFNLKNQNLTQLKNFIIKNTN